MLTPLLGVLAAGLLAVALITQRQIATFTQGAGSVLLTRLVLLAVGIGFGYVSMRDTHTPMDAALLFAIGFGLVHVPAAAILLIKRARGAGKT